MVSGARPSDRAASVDRVCGTDRCLPGAAGRPCSHHRSRLSRFLSQLEVGRTGTAFILDGSGELIAAPDTNADELHPAHSRIDMLPLARMAMNEAGDEGRNAASRHRLSLEGAAYEVALTPLPFPGWSLVTIIPETECPGAVETTLQRLIIGLAVGALLAASTRRCSRGR